MQYGETKKVCQKYNLFLIEDSAEAFGSEFKNSKAGTFGDISTFSFWEQNNNYWQGGMVFSHDKKKIEKVNYLKNQAVSEKEYWHSEIGYNYRMTNICAAKLDYRN